MIALRAPISRPFVAGKACAKPQRNQRRAFAVRATTEGPNSTSNEAAPATPVAPSTPVAPPTPKTPGFGEVMAFSGPAPEVVNGRLAMLGFLAALGAELSSSESILAQIQNPGSSSWLLYTFVLFIGASLIPLFKGAKNEAFGPFSPKAELINGRAAMIGFAAMLAIEAAKGSALF